MTPKYVTERSGTLTDRSEVPRDISLSKRHLSLSWYRVMGGWEDGVGWNKGGSWGCLITQFWMLRPIFCLPLQPNMCA